MDWLVVVLNKEKFYYSSSTLVEAGVIQSEHVVVHVCTCVCARVVPAQTSSDSPMYVAVSGKDVGELPGADLWKDIWVEREYGDSLVRCS